MEQWSPSFAAASNAPQAASPGAGASQRAALQARLNGLRWWTVNGSLLAAFVLTVLAIRHTDGVTAAASGTPALAQTAAAGPSLFQGQGDTTSAAGSGFLAPASSTGRGTARTRTS